MDGSGDNQSIVEKLKQPDPRSVAKPRPPTAELVKYVLVQLDVPRGNHEQFKQLMRPLVEIMFDLKQWELVFAAYPITGVVNRFVHIWRIPDESTIVEVMREGALQDEDGVAPPATNLEDEFRQVYQAVQGLVTSTAHTILTSLPYDPAHVGFQTHTVIIDTDREKFSIDHDRLRNEKGIEDIADDLEVLRRKRERVRTTTGVKAQQQKAGELGNKAREDELQLIQEHLNRGASVARVKLDKADALLFNLAALKPKGVFQQLDPAIVKRDDERTDFKLEVDLPVKSLLIATPWGSVYNLSKENIQGLSVSLKDDAVKAALQPLIDGKVPLAAVPEERDSTIGDGCACFIINLNSFVQSKAPAPAAVAPGHPKKGGH